MGWKNQFSHYCMQVSRMKSIFRKDLGKKYLQALLLSFHFTKGALKPFGLKGLFCAGSASFFLKSCFVYVFIYWGWRQRSWECSVTGYKYLAESRAKLCLHTPHQ